MSSTLSPLEEALINRVKETQDSEALTALINMHTGIYYSIASKYCRIYPDVIKINDLDDDRMTNMYRWIIDYKPNHNMKLGTYIGERTSYLCQDILKKDEQSPTGHRSASITSGDAAMVQPVTTEYEGESYFTSSGGHVVLLDETPIAQPAEVANKDIALQDIMKAIEDPHLKIDPRFKSIVEMRHFTMPPLTWRKIGSNVGISHEGVRKIYTNNLEKIKTAMNKDWYERV